VLDAGGRDGGGRQAEAAVADRGHEGGAGEYDLLLTPTIAGPPFPVGLDNATEIAGQAIEPYDWIPFTPPFNLTGAPACSVPCGFTSEKLPIGLHIVGRRFDDATVLRAARAFERAQPWAQHKPPLE
jgi:aspartyl-tRNA(Asn)/glutamyl-tRNA(Gln) amidotransferase subunit A